MSTSVILEGSVDKVGEDETKWNGVWRFAKDKKGILSFQYSKVSLEVARDLYEYVSFLDEATINAQKNGIKIGSSSSKYKKKVKSRPSNVSFFPATPAADETQVKKDSDTNMDTGDAMSHDDTTQNNQIEANNPEDTQGNNAMDVSMDVQEDGVEKQESMDEQDGVGTEQMSEQKTEAKNNDPIHINPLHPLMGVWQGSFAVKTLKGEEFINETLFFYTTLGAEMNQDFKDLPPEPQFPYILLKKLESTKVAVPPSPQVSSSSTAEKVESGTASSEQVEVKQEPSDSSNSTSILQNNHATELKIKVEENNTESVPAESIASVMDTQSTDVNSSLLESQLQDSEVFNSTAVSQAYGYSPAVLENLYKRVLIGFGRNPIGRFSIAAIFDEATGELKCEKKYMSVKYSIKRGRRSHAEYAMNYGSSFPSGPPPIIERPPSVRKSSFSVASLLEQDGSHITAKPRTSKTNAAAVVAAVTQSSYLLHDDDSGAPDAKRARKNSIGSSSKSKFGTASSTDALPVKEKKHYSKSAKDESHLMIYNNPNALVGSRNPDNDDPYSTYREAFQDVDTGEIYEGSWYNGFRQGHGICLYSDGLMYEGNWAKGKEYGKGDLMTGDRRVVYSGDWVDGLIHGHGTYNYGNGDKYIGDWKEGNKHGKGEYVFANGCLYSGDWKDNKRHGKGRFCWPDGSIYEGEWEHDQRQGRGILELMNGFRYDGTWSRNVMEGKGTCVFPSGQTYQGTFKNGLRDGRGSVMFAEGSVYEGRFREDKFEGHGTVKINNVVPGVDENELLIPVSIQSELWRIHWKAGFGHNAH